MQYKYSDNNYPSRVLSLQDPPKGQALRDFMMTFRDIVTLSWEVNSSVKVKFWRDSWNGSPPLLKPCPMDIFIVSLENSQDKYLIDYVSIVCLFSKKVISKDPGELTISSFDQDRFCQLLSSLVVYLSRQEDQLIWAPRKNGSYSIKEGYRILQQQEANITPSHAFSFCWNQFTLPKVGCFA